MDGREQLGVKDVLLPARRYASAVLKPNSITLSC